MTVPVMPVIVAIPCMVVSIIIIPVKRPPWSPVRRVVIPAPGGIPGYVSWEKDKGDHRPGCNFTIAGPRNDNRLPVPDAVVALIARVLSFTCQILVGIMGFYDVILSV
jgi:hypothetical protein